MGKPVTYRIHPNSVPYLTDAEIEIQARTLKIAYETACGSIKLPLDVEDIIWSLLQKRDNLVLEDPADLGYDQNNDRVLGYTAGNFEGGVTQIDISLVTTSRYWFTVAHELGHWTLHRTLLAEAYAAAQREEERRLPTLERNMSFGGQRKWPPEEWQANRFAVHLLMPEDIVRMKFTERISPAPINYREKYQRVGRFAQTYPTLRNYTLMLAGKDRPFDLRNIFRVSKEAMAIRIEELGLVIDKEPSKG